MSQKIYVGDENGKARDVYLIYASSTGTSRIVRKVYVGDSNNKARLCYELLNLSDTGLYDISAYKNGRYYGVDMIAANTTYMFRVAPHTSSTNTNPVCFVYVSPNGLGEMTSKYLDGLYTTDSGIYTCIDAAPPIGTTQIAFSPIYHSPTVEPWIFAATDAGTIYGDDGEVITTLSSGASINIPLIVGDACTIKSSADEAWLFYGDGTEEMLQFSSGQVAFTVKEELESIEFYSV